MKLSCLLLIGPALAFAADDSYAAALFQKNSRQRAKQIYSSFFLYERIIGVRSPLHRN